MENALDLRTKPDLFTVCGPEEFAEVTRREAAGEFKIIGVESKRGGRWTFSLRWPEPEPAFDPYACPHCGLPMTHIFGVGYACQRCSGIDDL